MQVLDENIIFLISQPRSGSSMLQQILMNGNNIGSHPESWLLLALFQPFLETESDHEFGRQATRANFIRTLDEFNVNRDEIKHQIREIYLNILTAKYESESFDFILEKTPRYYHILEEIQTIFPRSKKIILTRNPLAVFASILEYNFKGDVIKMLRPDRLDDLIKAPGKLANFIRSSQKGDYLHIRYEDIVLKPSQVAKSISEFLGKGIFKNDSLEYQLDGDFLNTDSVDKKSLQKHDGVSKDYLNVWKQVIDTKLKKDLALQCIERLDANDLSIIGYSKSQILKELKDHKVKYSFPVNWEFLTKEAKRIKSGDFLRARISIKLNQLIND